MNKLHGLLEHFVAETGGGGGGGGGGEGGAYKCFLNDAK